MCEDNISFGDLSGCRDYMSLSKLSAIEDFERSSFSKRRKQTTYHHGLTPEDFRKEGHSFENCWCNPLDTQSPRGTERDHWNIVPLNAS